MYDKKNFGQTQIEAELQKMSWVIELSSYLIQELHYLVCIFLGFFTWFIIGTKILFPSLF